MAGYVRDWMQMSDILCSPDDTCANVDLEQMPILGPNPEQKLLSALLMVGRNSIQVTFAPSKPISLVSKFKNSYIGPSQIMTMSDYNV
jgi:hypothetical protein